MDSSPKNHPAAEEGGRSLGALFRELRREGALLIRQELTLARMEATRAGSRAARASALIVVWATIAAVGGLAIAAGLVVLVGHLVGSYWLGALLVSVALLIAGGIGALSSWKKLRGTKLMPERAVRSAQTTQRWAQAEAAEARAVLARGDGRASGDGRARGGAPVLHNRIAAVWPEPESPSARQQVAPADQSQARTEQERKQERARKNPGVWGLIKTTGKEILDDDVPGQAAGVAYYAFLSLPPAIMMIFALAGFFGGATLADWIRSQANMILPASASGLISGFIQETVEHNAPGPFSIGLLLALWGASGVFMGLGSALNQAYDIEKQRSWIKRRAIAVGVMIVAVALFLLAGGALLVGPGLAHAVGLFGAGELAWQILKWPIAFCFMVAAFWIVYYVLPNKDQSDEKGTLLVGALIAAVLWVVATALFRLYVANFSSYSQTYGILGTIIVLLLYLYVTSIVVLAGGELAAEMEVRS